MTTHVSEGIILQITPYRDFDAILSVFSPEGQLSLFKRGFRRAKRQGILSPLTHVELTYRCGSGELNQCQQITVLHPYLALRQDLPTLEAACAMAQAIRKILVPNQDTQLLFKQILQCYTYLPHLADPKSAVCWFHVQILKHEGLLDPAVDQQIALLIQIDAPEQLMSVKTSLAVQKKVESLFDQLIA